MTERIKKPRAFITLGRVRVHFSVPVLLALFFVGGRGDVFAALMLSAAIHEAGHLLAIRALGFGVAEISITALGAAIKRRGLTGYRHDIFIAAMGPAFSAAAFGISYALWVFGAHGEFLSLFCGLNLILCLLNLVPAWPLDGGVMMLGELYLRYDAAHARALAFYIALSSSIALFCLGGVLFYHTGYNVSLILILLFLLFGVSRFEKLV